MTIKSVFDHDEWYDLLIVPYEILLDHKLTAKEFRVLLAIFSVRKANTCLDTVNARIISDITGYSADKVLAINDLLVAKGWTDITGNIRKLTYEEEFNEQG